MNILFSKVYCKLRCPIDRLLKEADRVNYKLAVDPVILCNVLVNGRSKGKTEKQWAPISMPLKSVETSIDPYEYIYMDYRIIKPGEEEDSNFSDSIYKSWPNSSKLRGVDRLKLLALILKVCYSRTHTFIHTYIHT